jgi:hypothetical protein
VIFLLLIFFSIVPCKKHGIMFAGAYIVRRGGFTPIDIFFSLLLCHG